MRERVNRFMNQRDATDMPCAQREFLGTMGDSGLIQHDPSNARLVIAQQTGGYQRACGDSVRNETRQINLLPLVRVTIRFASCQRRKIR